MDPSAARRYRGDFVAWTGGCAFIGEGGGEVAPHAHYAIQLVVGAPRGLRVQFGLRGPWQDCAAAVVPSRATHSIDVSACGWATVLFIEPETPEGKALTARLRGTLEVLDGEVIAGGAQRLYRAWSTEQDPQAVQAACLALVREVSRTAPAAPSDPRIVQALEYLRQRVNAPVTLGEVAAAAHLSPSRFRHLFVQETGMPLRTYLLWRRLLHVWELLMHGETLSGAAHAAGFADSAHLSRTARTMFGLAPSALQMNGPLRAASASRPTSAA